MLLQLYFFSFLLYLADVLAYNCTNYGSFSGPKRIDMAEALCSPNGHSALWFDGNQCRIRICELDFQNNKYCKIGYALPSWDKWNFGRICPAHEGYLRYTEFLSDGDLVIYADVHNDGKHIELWRLSTSQFGSAFKHVESGINSLLTICNGGKIMITVDGNLVWTNDILNIFRPQDCLSETMFNPTAQISQDIPVPKPRPIKKIKRIIQKKTNSRPRVSSSSKTNSRPQVSSSRPFTCISFGTFVGSKINLNEALCSPDGQWALFLDGNQCRIVICGPEYNGDISCRKLVAFSSNTSLRSECPSQEGYDRYVGFSLHGDMTIYADTNNNSR